MIIPPTFLKYFQMFPQDVAHERRRAVQEGLTSHVDEVVSGHTELANHDSL